MPTCTYDGATIFVQDGIPTTAPMYWYDIIHKFSWRTWSITGPIKTATFTDPNPSAGIRLWYAGGVTGGTNFWAGW